MTPLQRRANARPFFLVAALLTACGGAPQSPAKPEVPAQADAAPGLPLTTSANLSDISTLKQRCDGGDGASCVELASLTSSGDHTGSLAYLRRACDSGTKRACTVVGEAALLGVWLPRDLGLAATLFRSACEGGDGAACFYQGVLYDLNRPQPNTDVPRARAAYAHGCELGDGLSCATSGSRIPEPAQACADPVTGTCLSAKFFPERSEWYVFELVVHRSSSQKDHLEGTIRTHYWRGTDADTRPNACLYNRAYERAVRMTAEGEIAGGRVAFRGREITLDAALCGERNGNYRLDVFSGAIDAKTGTYDAVDDDGTQPGMRFPFRRIRCAQTP
jgi:hypothetical protein